MTTEKTNYRQNELLHVAPLPAEYVGQIKIQIRTEKGATRWLNISPREFKEIEKALLSSED